MNKNLFGTLPKPNPTDTTNEAGGAAYSLPPHEAMVTLGLTTTFNDSFYTKASDQLTAFRDTAAKCDPSFLAKLAVYSREKGFMKDAPAALLAILAGQRQGALLRQAFPRVVNNGKMLRGFMQAIRSGQLGRKSLGTVPLKLMTKKLVDSTPKWLLRASVGQHPSLRDVLRLVRPKPKDKRQEALFGYFVGAELLPGQVELLPKEIQEYEAFKRADAPANMETPDVPFELLSALKLKPEHWRSMARNAGWHWLRMNLNNLSKYGAFFDKVFTVSVAAMLRNPEQIKRSRVFPYQLLAAYANTTEIPDEVRGGLLDAMEVATENVPAIEGKVVVGVDVSGSMKSPITGYRPGATSKVSCVGVAALIAACVLRKNKEAKLLPFDTVIHDARIEPRDTVTTNAQKLASYGGGGTAVSLPVAWAQRHMPHADVVIIVSDNMSWADLANPGSATMAAWLALRRTSPKVKLVTIDIQATTTSQVDASRNDILRVAGWSDAIWLTIDRWLKGAADPGKPTASALVKEIEAIDLTIPEKVVDTVDHQAQDGDAPVEASE